MYALMHTHKRERKSWFYLEGKYQINELSVYVIVDCTFHIQKLFKLSFFEIIIPFYHFFLPFSSSKHSHVPFLSLFQIHKKKWSAIPEGYLGNQDKNKVIARYFVLGLSYKGYGCWIQCNIFFCNYACPTHLFL